MTRLRHAAVPALLAATILAACDGENLFTTGVVGARSTYQADSIMVNRPDSAAIDLVGQGAQFDLTLFSADKTFESSFDHLALHVDIQGEYRMSDTTIVFSDDPFQDDEVVTERVFDLDEHGDQLTLSDATASYDLDDDGFAEPVQFRVFLTRR